MKKPIVFLLILTALCSAFLFPGCGLIDSMRDKVPTTYSNPEKYTVGNTEFEGKVDNLNIWWLDGSVTVRTHKENTVRIEETSNKEAEDNFKLRWRYYNAADYGEVLDIRYSASGEFDYGDLKKDITVYLPENDDMDVSLTIQTASVDVDLSEFENTLDEIYVINYSGKVSVTVDNAEEVRISGQNSDNVPESQRLFSFKANGTVDDLGISTSYAALDISVKEAINADIGTVFADLSFGADRVNRLKLSNSAGRINARVPEFESIDIETWEQPCELALSPEASFKLTMKEKDRFNHRTKPESIEVKFDNATSEGAVYTVGDGKNIITVATASKLTILPYEE